MALLEEWLTTENLLSIIVVLMGWTNRQNATIQKLLKPLSTFITVATAFIDKSDEHAERIERIDKFLDKVEV